MRIDDIVFFSPRLRLEDLDLSDKSLVISSFNDRINSYYIDPASALVKQKSAFAAGAL